MNYTLSIDPGKVDSGLALFKNGVLIDAQLIKGADPFNVVQNIAEFVKTFDIHFIAVEGQRVYPGPSKGDPNDLFPLAQVVGGVLAAVPHSRHQIILPQEWTKRVPKDVRVKKFLSSMTEDEARIVSRIKCVKSKQHNVIDAICMGKYAIGKWVPNA